MSEEINALSTEVAAMAVEWPQIDALMAGTAAMRAAGKALLPMEPRESEEDWKYRLDTATLFPAYRRTVGVMAGKPFSKALTFSQDTPANILLWCDDCDLQGRNLHAFAAETLNRGIAWGIAGILVEHQVRKPGEQNTQNADKVNGYRPYLVAVRHSQLRGWRVSNGTGPVRLTMLRIAESATIDVGDFGTATVNRVRVLTPGAFRLWEERENSWVIIDEGLTTLSEIPFVPVYGEQTGFMTGRPPLLNLAYQNTQHWQQQSDQNDSARFARKRLLVISGVEDSTPLTMASNYALSLPKEGKAEIVQGSAECVTVGRSELQALEEQMIQTGAELLVQKPGQRTATEANNDAEANKSELQRIVEAFEDALDYCLYFMGAWVGEKTTGSVTLFKDFSAGSLSEASAELVLKMQQGGVITKVTAIKEQQRRGILSPDLDAEAELEAVGDEGPALGKTRNADGQ